MKDKNLAVKDFFEMIHKSWSWEKLTEQERETFTHYVNLSSYYPQGTYAQAYRTVQNYYQFFTMNLNLEER